MVDDTEFVFGKVWRGAANPEAWPEDKTMTVKLYRSATGTVEDSVVYESYTVQPTGVEIHNDLITYALPSTGGPGTGTYTLAGVALISLALFLLFRRRRDC